MVREYEIGTCFAARDPDDIDTLLCDRHRNHVGRHAATHLVTGRRYYWKKVP